MLRGALTHVNVYNETMPPHIKTYSYEELCALVAELGQPKFRADQLTKWLYAEGVHSYNEMTNLPKPLRKHLTEQHPLHILKLASRQVSVDGTCKYLLEFHDQARIETVAIPTGSPDKDPSRLTVCVSTQVGCAMGCTFCATGQQEFTRNLVPGEIVDQVLFAQSDFGVRVSNLVIMGQGEPFLNYENTLAALRFLNSSQGLEIGARHITVSTCGIIPGIQRFAEEPEQFTLAISLHSAIQSTRDQLMPHLKHYPLPALKRALSAYQATSNRRITFEYIMIEGINDTPESLLALQDFCSNLHCHVDLLPINPVKKSSFQPSKHATINKWMSHLSRSHIEVTLRNSRGSDIAGACGQLNSHTP